MKYRFGGDQSIAENVLDAIKFTGKVGFMSKQMWHEFFGTGNRRWQNKQLKFIVDLGYFKKHRNEYATKIFVLTPRSIRLLEDMNLPQVTPVPVGYLTHDAVVARSMLVLLQGKVIGSFTVERELKTYGAKEFLLSNKDNDQKYPDAVFRMFALGSARTVAVEYEKERKSSARYMSALWQYSRLTNLSMVLFICETPAIQKTIEGCMKHLGQTNLLDRLAFVSADDWKQSPLDAVICLRNHKVKLREFCSSSLNSEGQSR